MFNRYHENYYQYVIICGVTDRVLYDIQIFKRTLTGQESGRTGCETREKVAYVESMI